MVFGVQISTYLLGGCNSIHDSHQVYKIIIGQPYEQFTSFVPSSRYCTQTMYLINPTHETLELQQTNSNPDNFVLDAFISPVSIFRKPTNLPLLQYFPILILGHCRILLIELLISFQMSKI